jgi:hypothetical protein
LLVSGSRDGSWALNRQTFTDPWAGLPMAWFGSGGLNGGAGVARLGLFQKTAGG